MLRFSAAVVVTMLAAPVAAHITLEVPQVRYSNQPSEQNKSCPCGAGPGNRYCDNGVRSDDNRARDRVTTYAAGETIMLLWDETVAHGGRYRIAFDNDGADLDDFNAHILGDVVDPEGSSGNLGTGNGWGVAVTLPNEPCDNCTLQLIQVMNGNTVDEVSDPTGESTYYQCADIVIVAAGTGTGEGEGEGEGTVGGEGEGEGEGEAVDDVVFPPTDCASAPGPLFAGLLVLLRRRRRHPLQR